MPFTLPSTISRPVAVLGGGVLGRRIACVWAAGGYTVNIRDPSASQRTSALHYCETSIGTYPRSSARPGPVQVFEDLSAAVKDAWLIVECVPEKLPIKIATFADLEKIAPTDAILASNSSSYKTREMLGDLRPETRQRILNMHYMMPPDNIVVELMTDGETDPQIFPFLVGLLREVHMHPIVARKESTGFVINRLWAAIKREALTILAEGVSVPEEIDSVWIEMYTKHAIGPCQMMDGVGLDTVAFIEEHYIKERGLSPDKTVDYLKPFIKEGRLGAKSSKGGLYPPGYHVKTTDEDAGWSDNLNAPLLYFLDIGLANLPKDVASGGKILCATPSGKRLRTIVDKLHMPDGIVVSILLQRIFWTNMGIPAKNDGSIMSAKLDGSDIKTIVGNGQIHTPKQIALDTENNQLYFSDREGERIFRCSIDGSELEVIYQAGDYQNPEHAQDQTRWCVGIAVSPEQGKFYWTQKGAAKSGRGRIFRTNIATKGTASARQDIECLFSNLPEPIDLAIDEEGQNLFWTDRGELPRGNTINRAALKTLKTVPESYNSLDGKDYEIVVQNLHEAIGLCIDSKNQHIYAADLGGTVYRFNIDGKDKKKLFEDSGSFSGLTLSHY